MMVGARTAAWSGKALPYLRRVAYLESSGTQYVDFGVTPVFNDSFEIEYSIPDHFEMNIPPFGCLNYTCVNQKTNKKQAFYPRFFTTGAQALPNYVYDPNYKYVINIENRIVTFLQDGVEFDTLNIGKYEANGSLWCFGRSDTKAKANKMRCYRFKIRDIDTIPVLDLSGRPAMYDEVSGQFFYNQGTGEFTWGELDG